MVLSYKITFFITGVLKPMKRRYLSILGIKVVLRNRSISKTTEKTARKTHFQAHMISTMNF